MALGQREGRNAEKQPIFHSPKQAPRMQKRFLIALLFPPLGQCLTSKARRTPWSGTGTKVSESPGFVFRRQNQLSGFPTLVLKGIQMSPKL